MAKLIIAGIGPGNAANMTAACRDALESSTVIVGYTAYIDLIRPLYPDKDLRATAMKTETERCRESLELAAEGKNVCLVSSGDSGIYGMASLALELSAAFPAVTVELIPGITAASSGGALLGAPLGHDFAVISLSDLLTPWELIAKRLRAAAEADFAICIYNPKSHNRDDYLEKAAAILLETLPPERVCGLARNIGRDGENTTVTTLGGLSAAAADMFTTVFIGSSGSKVVNGKMITSRGYHEAKASCSIKKDKGYHG
jgi:precorrin-3B C17-methyltransferase